MANNNLGLVHEIRLKSKYYLDQNEVSENVLKAFLQVDRINFLPKTEKKYAYSDQALSIGYGQTCSQPSMVAFMLDKLEIKPYSIILEIGSGCGYAASIASILCKPSGIVYTSEIITELSEILKNNTSEYTNIKFAGFDGSEGFKDLAPFDGIFLSAGVKSDFKSEVLIDQLNAGGILIYPEQSGYIYKITKTENGLFNESYYGVSFVPLMGKNS